MTFDQLWDLMSDLFPGKLYHVKNKEIGLYNTEWRVTFTDHLIYVAKDKTVNGQTTVTFHGMFDNLFDLQEWLMENCGDSK